MALVYNLKEDHPGEQSLPEESTEPPSLSSIKLNINTIPNRLLIAQHHSSDLFAEWDSFETIDAIRVALSEVHEVSLIEADEQAYTKLLTERPDLVFNIAEGLYGVSREAQIPAMLDMLKIPYVGSDPLTLALCLDKSRAKEILAFHHIPTPKFLVVSKLSDLERFTQEMPCIVKPLHEGSSKGITNSSLVKNQSDLRREVSVVLKRYEEPALIETYLNGREFTVAMLGNGDDVRILPIVEIKFDTLPENVNPIYSYEAKWIWDRPEAPLDIFECPANISIQLRNEIEAICRRAYSVLRCRDWCRIDVRLDSQGKPNILELNPLPGILPDPKANSCFPKAARAAGISYNELIQTVLDIALKRHGIAEQRQSNYQLVKEES